jgi:hypothetical protein
VNFFQHQWNDLAPGDLNARDFDWSPYQVTRINSSEDPLFESVYSKLWEEFAPKGEIEEKSVIQKRLNWDLSPLRTEGPLSTEYSLKYEIIAVTQNDRFVAARDHSVIIRRGTSPQTVVHLSHALIDPKHRGLGMAGWLRTWPVDTAKRCLQELGYLANTPITLVAEMEPHLPQSQVDSGARFKSYRKAGFHMVFPAKVNYLQPDFSSPAEIDLHGGPRPLPLRLVLRRIGLEGQTVLPASEIKELVTSLYFMYENSFRSQDMEPLWKHLNQSYPLNHDKIQLIPPGTEAVA